MGLDMYLETMPKIKDYTVEQIHELGDIAETKDTFERATKALEDLKAMPYEEVGDKYGLMVFSNDTHERFESRIRKYVEDSETQTMYNQSLSLDEQTIEDITMALMNKEEVAYWRKANQIHAYFIDRIAGGVDDCKPFAVTKEQLEELRRNCLAVLENPEKAEELLPTQGGFFFGSTDYDEYYLQDLMNTIGQLTGILDNVNFDTTYVLYQASW